MDRSDERNDRVGDVLGLGNITSEPTDIRPTSDDTEDSEQARRHERMTKGADRILTGSDEPPRRSGATGIDTGAGGEGTDIEE